MPNYNSGILIRLEENQTDQSIDTINYFLCFCFVFVFFFKNEFHLNINQS